MGGGTSLGSKAEGKEWERQDGEECRYEEVRWWREMRSNQERLYARLFGLEPS